MTNGETKDRTPGPAAPEPPAYVPPAVAWEEEFEPLAQCSVPSSGGGGGGGDC